MEIKFLKDIKEEQWNEYIHHHSDSKIYHTLEWKKVLEETYSTLNDRYLVSLDKNNSVNGIMPLFKIKSLLFGNRLSSLPLSNYAEILADNNQIRDALIEQAIEMSKSENCKFLEIRENKHLNKECINKFKLTEMDDYLTVIVPLSENPEDLWLKMNKARRKSINKSKKEGIVIRESNDLDDLKKHYEILLDIRKDQGVPSYGFKFFKNMHEHLFKKDYARLYLAEKDGKVLFALVAFLYKKTMTAGYGMARKEKEFANLHASELAYWHCFEWACNNGFKEFDFGRCNKKQESLIEYKQRWGGKIIDTPYYFVAKKGVTPGIHHTSSKFDLLKKIWRIIPSPITEYIGPKVFAHLL